MYTKKFYFDAKNHLPFPVLRCDQYPLRRKRKRAKNRRSTHVLARDATGIDRLAKRRTGGDFSHRNTTFLYTSLSSVINTQILNCAGSFDGVSWRTAARTAGEPWSTLRLSGCRCFRRFPSLRFRLFCLIQGIPFFKIPFRLAISRA